MESVWRKKKRRKRRRSKRGSISLTADHLPVVTGQAVKGTSVFAASSGVSPVVFAEDPGVFVDNSGPIHCFVGA